MKTFEEYLKEKHSETYMGTDDSMPEAFENWLDTDEMMSYADEFITTLLEKQKEEYVEMIRDYQRKDSDFILHMVCNDIINLINKK